MRTLPKDNPFIEGLINRAVDKFRVTSPIIRKATVVVDRDTGEFLRDTEDRVFDETEKVLKDDDNFVKVFPGEGNLFDLFRVLNKGAISLLVYVMEIIKPNSEEVVIDAEDYMERLYGSREQGIKNKPGFYRSVQELINHNVLAKKSPKTYYINPEIFFNGRRESLPFLNKNIQEIARRKFKKEVPKIPTTYV